MTKRKVTLYIATSIDGFIADKDGGIDWLSTGESSEIVDTSYDDFYKDIDTVILGRRTYDQIVNELSPDVYPYASSISYVLTSQARPNKEQITFTNRSIVELVTNQKKQTGQDIFIVGGSQTIAPLVEANLIDHYQLATIPIILGEGIPLFQPMTQNIFLKPLSTKLVNHIMYQTFEKI